MGRHTIGAAAPWGGSGEWAESSESMGIKERSRRDGVGSYWGGWAHGAREKEPKYKEGVERV